MTAGIDDIAIYIPRLYIDATDFAKARGLDPVKLQKGLGVSLTAGRVEKVLPNVLTRRGSCC